YDEADVFTWPATFVKTGDKTFTLGPKEIAKSPLCRIVFPNPMQHSLEWTKIFIGLTFAAFGILAQTGWSLRERKTKWVATVLIAGAVVVGVVIFFALQLSDARRLEFLTVAVVAIPNAAYAIVAATYTLLAKGFQAGVAGQVYIDNAPGQWVH